jgi:hypothetical protein
MLYNSAYFTQLLLLIRTAGNVQICAILPRAAAGICVVYVAISLLFMFALGTV